MCVSYGNCNMREDPSPLSTNIWHCAPWFTVKSEGGREGGRERGREEGREGGREGEREGGREKGTTC